MQICQITKFSKLFYVLQNFKNQVTHCVIPQKQMQTVRLSSQNISMEYIISEIVGHIV